MAQIMFSPIHSFGESRPEGCPEQATSLIRTELRDSGAPSINLLRPVIYAHQCASTGERLGSVLPSRRGKGGVRARIAH